jgi:EmrB/QacA subfamily drug resistance transporter
MRRTTLIPLVVACALFMENMDSTVIATSLPAIAADIGENPLALKLALTSYLVSLAVFIPVSGWVADRYGSRTVFAWAIGVFMAGSLLSGASSTLFAFVVARFIQGMGGAMMVPVGRLVLLRAVPKGELVAALNLLTIPAMLGPLMGPPLGGFITQAANWRWIFLINLPIGALGLYLVMKHIPNVRETDNPPLDVRGFLLSGVGLSVLMLGLSTLGGHLVSRNVSLLCLVTGAIALAFYVRHARRSDYPLLDITLLKQPGFFNGVVAGNLFRLGTGSLPFLLPLLLQLGFGLSPLESGLITCASAAGVLVMKTSTVRVLKRYGFRRVLVANCLAAGGAIALCALFRASTPHWAIIAVLFGSGCLRSLQFTALNAVTFADVHGRQMSRATSFSSMAQRLAQSLGIAVGAYILEIVSTMHGRSALQANDFGPAFLVMALISCSAIVFHIRMPANIGAEVSGHQAHPKAQTE